MFEEVFVNGKNRKQKIGSLAVSTALQVVILVILLLIPLLSQPALVIAGKYAVALPPPPPPAPKPAVDVFTPPKVEKTFKVPPGTLITPTEIPNEIAKIIDEGPPTGGVPGGDNTNRVRPCVICDILKNTQPPEAAPAPPPPPPPPPPAPPERIRVGGNVQAANLVDKVVPVYPPLAKQARVQGAVVLEAVIGKDGSITNLKVISGHPLLNQAAIDAVKQWRYKPTLLNGEPVEVVTTITVTFGFSQ